MRFKELKPQTLWHDVSLPNLFDTENNINAIFVRSSHEGCTLTQVAKTEVGKPLDCTDVEFYGPWSELTEPVYKHSTVFVHGEDSTYQNTH